MTYFDKYSTEGTNIGTAKLASSTAKYECREYRNNIIPKRNADSEAIFFKNVFLTYILSLQIVK